LNSVRSVGRAIDYEARRQVDMVTAGEQVRQETRHWDEGDGRTHTLRTKEDADDYRYFPEPDLVPLAPSEEWIAEVRASMPPLPAARRACLAEATGQAADAEAITTVVDRGQDDYVHAVVAAGGDAARALIAVKEAFADEGAEPRVPAGDLAVLTQMEVAGELTSTQAKTVLAEIVAAGGGDARGDRSGEGLRGDGHLRARGDGG
jgi:aspartyl-tRNA(Asn)/glutamyl-tRNA(Gln) amidotransferase subunit B